MQGTMGLQWVQGGKKEGKWASRSGRDRCRERTDSRTTEGAGEVVSGQSHWVYPERRKGRDLVWELRPRREPGCRRGDLSLNTS